LCQQPAIELIVGIAEEGRLPPIAPLRHMQGTPAATARANRAMRAAYQRPRPIANFIWYPLFSRDRQFRMVSLIFPDVRFAVVGARPAPAVRRLAERPGILVTGRVPDVRPWLAHATLAVAPLRIARGVQNKVLEAMAMARPVLCTPAAAAGIEAVADRELAVAEDAQAFAVTAQALLDDAPRRQAMAAAARRRIETAYDWRLRLAALDRVTG
jgi:hypothetical protein